MLESELKLGLGLGQKWSWQIHFGPRTFICMTVYWLSLALENQSNYSAKLSVPQVQVQRDVLPIRESG